MSSLFKPLTEEEKDLCFERTRAFLSQRIKEYASAGSSDFCLKVAGKFKGVILVSSEVSVYKEFEDFLILVSAETRNPAYFFKYGATPYLYYLAKAREFDPVCVVAVENLAFLNK